MDNHIHPWLRRLWAAAFIISIGILLASLPAYVNRWLGGEQGWSGLVITRLGDWLGVILSLSAVLLSLTLACLLYIKKAEEPMALFLSFYLLMYGIALSGPLEALTTFWIPQIPSLGTLIQQGLFFPFTLALFLIFPCGKFTPRWTRWLLLLIVSISVLVLILDPVGMQSVNSTSSNIVSGIFGAFFLFALGNQFFRYRRLYTPIERQQTKWVVYGFLLWTMMLTLISIPYYYLLNLPVGAPTPWWTSLGEAGWWLTLNIIPIAFTLAIMRSRLWDIDVITVERWCMMG